jgi:cell division protein YceG involved in septum cleavage
MLLIAFNVNAQSGKQITKTLTVESAITVVDLPGDIVTKSWNGDYIKIDAKISSNNTTDDILGKLLSAGRYEFKSTIEGGNQIINMPKILNKVTLKSGVTVEEIFKFEISVPYGTVLQNLKYENLVR